MSALSWVALAAGLFVWPLLVVGVFLREEVLRCPDCRAARGQGRVTFEAGPALVVFGVIAALALLGALWRAASSGYCRPGTGCRRAFPLANLTFGWWTRRHHQPPYHPGSLHAPPPQRGGDREHRLSRDVGCHNPDQLP